MSKVAMVTGGASGIGAAISRRLARRGDKVAILDLQGDTLAATHFVSAGRGIRRPGIRGRRHRPAGSP